MELCAKIQPLAAKHDAILLENHGVVTVGADLVTAYRHMETVEHSARVMLTAESLGGHVCQHVRKYGSFAPPHEGHSTRCSGHKTNCSVQQIVGTDSMSHQGNANSTALTLEQIA